MGIIIKSIANLPYKKQEECLERMILFINQDASKVVPIEIDGKLYQIPDVVQTLIDGLWDMIEGANEQPKN